ncbi:hypothetical protein [Clostridium sp. UBA1056]|uniref:hypothetical protein n=1 Tax=unclassified Clostridium TaxID=2614128 RepID=UPI0032167AC0
MKRIICLLLIGLMTFTTVACQNKVSENIKDKNVEENIESEAMESYNEKMKESIEEVLPEIADDIRKVLVKNGTKIDSQLDLSKMQILLFSNMNHKAYLINSQNDKYGAPDENIEYSTDTFKDKTLLTRMFDITEFNDRKTYIFNVDTFAYNGLSKEELKEELEKSIIHEAIHLVLQSKQEENIQTGEELMGSNRSVEYPLDSKSRVYRAQQMNFYKKALEAKTEEERIDFIKKGNYFYKKFLEVNPNNITDSELDKIEGQPRYFEYRGLALLKDINQSEDELKESTRIKFLENNYEINPDTVNEMGKNGEFYAIGSLGYANIYALNIEKDFGFINPSKYLLDKFGFTENAGDEELEKNIEKHYNDMNSNIKERVDKFTGEMNNPDYITIKIPVFKKYEENGNVEIQGESIKYLYKGNENTLENVTKEIKLGDNRVLIKSTDIMSELDTTGDDEYYYINIPKKDIAIEDNRLTVQLKSLQVYGSKFVEKDGMYILEE